MTKQKRVKLTEGDVFELTVPDGRLGYGVIIKRGVLETGGTPYIAMFRPLYLQRPNLLEFTNEEVALAGWTTDALVYHGRWTVIAHDLPLPRVPFPNFVVGMNGKFYVTDVEGRPIREADDDDCELLDYQFSCSALGFQDAFEALHGFRQWEESYDKITLPHAQARTI